MVMFSSWPLTVQCLQIPLSRDSTAPAFRGGGLPCGVTVSASCQEDWKMKVMVGRLHFLAENSQHTLLHIFVFL